MSATNTTDRTLNLSTGCAPTVWVGGTPQVWIGCMSHHNDGTLVGEWFDAIDADEVTVADVHRGSDRSGSHCEELHCFDTSGIPVSGEMSPHEAAEWARALTSVDEHLRPALRQWVASGDYVTEGTGDLPSISDFEDRYCGEWDSFREYAEDLADDIGLLAGAPEVLARYFHWDAWIRDLAFDFTTAPAPAGGIFVFRNL
ncbi:antirestriction protein ArdA [Candidatus Microthrix parvicella]|uniref:Putative antirestriction protein ArdA n=1 Tax=Candidatus Neomicrothrix parvicella RN1 TaxID=1229780 RepID=R4YW10_9ACTN|nr:antirestriction protein ArdA [Candidatus Microthrix parvicella]CCM62035.1 putative antirestriction protein ArdA [Candidatus Microthrix parvicella RN1]